MVRKINSTSSASPTPSVSSGRSLYPLTHFLDYNTFSTSHRHFLALVTAEIEPTMFSDAVINPKWRLAMQQEIHALEKMELGR